MSSKLSDAELAAIRVEVKTNAHPREPETRYILGLLDHAAAVESELATAQTTIEELRAAVAGQGDDMADRQEAAEWHQLATSVAALHQAKR